MSKYFVAYFATAVVFLGIDFVWLAKVAKGIYFDQIGEHLRETPNFIAAGIFYAVFVIGIVIFAIAPAFRDGSIGTAILYGALFGFFTYATYEMTSYAIMKNWTVNMVVIDVVWGVVLTAFSAAAGYWITQQVFGG